MQLLHDISLNIATGLSAKSKVWKNSSIQWSELINKLSSPVITRESYTQFVNAGKEEQARIKDVGGFVGGYVTKNKREKANILYRQLVTLDIDFSYSEFWWDFTMVFDCAAFIHSTHKSCPEKPRHRLLIPLNREVTQEEYQAIARKIAGMLDIDLFDQSTFDVNRLMFWPSVSADMEYYYEYQDGEILDADYILGLYQDWHDITEWPTASTNDVMLKAIGKQEDPEQKKGLVGLFCRAYTIQAAIEAFLPDIYIKVDDTRYTYAKGSTAAGLIVYNDKFAYSHHGTDPAGNRLCNAFDLVRIHKFGYLDEGSRESVETSKKSFKAMEEFISKDSLCKKQLAFEKFEEAKFEFSDNKAFQEVTKEDSFNEDWLTTLEVNIKGEYENSASNLNTILQNDQFLKNAFKLNTFDNKRYIAKSLPWRVIPEGAELDLFKDVDFSGVRNYIECVYGIVASQKVDDALALEFEHQKFHPIISYLTSLAWDGVPRVDTLLIEYFGAKDTAYTRAVIRKTLCAAVARVLHPGIKFDTITILVGAQGTYKSTFVKKLGKDWFSDTFLSVQGKESFEQLQGAWIIEIAELAGLKKAEVETIKHFASKSEDSFRPAYGRVVETYKRQCVFFGTTNTADFLRDTTGNRRFMPVDVRPMYVKKSVVNDLTEYEIDQIWAEAYQLYLKGENLYFSEEETALAIKEQSDHAETDERKGIIESYLDLSYPNDWDNLDLTDRRVWLTSPLSRRGTVIKDITCVAEVWCECLSKDKSELTVYNTREISNILKAMPGWTMQQGTYNFPLYGRQKYFMRDDNMM